MREIKFRAWDKMDKTLLDVGLINFKFGIVETLLKESKNGIDTNLRDIEEMELMQFTGLKDRNGTEIYEGDIVKGPFYPHESNNEIGIVTFDEFEWPRFAVKSRNIYYNYPHDYRDCGLNEWVEIIGNIYENKELLEAEG